MATKKEIIQKRNTAMNITENAILASETLVETSLAFGAKWQKLMAKALTEGTTLFGKQQDLTLTTLEGIKNQVVSGNKRFRKLFNIPMPTINRSLKVKKTAKAENKVKTQPNEAGKKDNLKMIEGIGPKIETLLNKAGFSTFSQLASANIKDLKTILEAAGPRYKTLNPIDWKNVAKTLVQK